jgi:hypothetical protein
MIRPSVLEKATAKAAPQVSDDVHRRNALIVEELLWKTFLFGSFGLRGFLVI